jgi:protein-disulfide isomerase
MLPGIWSPPTSPPDQAHPTRKNMASRKTQKEAARERRIAEERAAAEKAQRTRRIQMLSGVVAIVVIVVIVVIVLSTSGGGSTKTVKASSPKAKSAVASINTLLKGIPQNGTTLGKSSAPVTVTEYGDLECPVCKDFALGAENTLITKDVRTGKVKLVYKSFPTATANGPDPSVFPTQQAAAYAAGAQNRAWNYIETFYHEQGTEDTSYVTTAYLNGLAKQISGLNIKQWSEDRFNPTYESQVSKEERQAQSLGIDATPGFVVSSAKSQTKATTGLLTYADLQKLIKQVS